MQSTAAGAWVLPCVLAASQGLTAADEAVERPASTAPSTLQHLRLASPALQCHATAARAQACCALRNQYRRCCCCCCVPQEKLSTCPSIDKGGYYVSSTGKRLVHGDMCNSGLSALIPDTDGKGSLNPGGHRGLRLPPGCAAATSFCCVCVSAAASPQRQQWRSCGAAAVSVPGACLWLVGVPVELTPAILLLVLCCVAVSQGPSPVCSRVGAPAAVSTRPLAPLCSWWCCWSLGASLGPGTTSWPHQQPRHRLRTWQGLSRHSAAACWG